MVRTLAAIGAAISTAAFPAAADPGPHHDQSAAQLVTHVLMDGFHVGHIIALVAVALASLGIRGVVGAARSGFRR